MKIALLASGGVDSSVALALLKNKGYDITAYYLKIWLEDELSFLGDCPWEEDLTYVRKICEQFSVPLKILSLQKEYHNKVVSYSLEELKKGRTPSPDIFCNKRIKFGTFYERIGDNYDKVASGHYARVEEKNGIFSLKMSPDPIKDQTYFLAHLSQKQLSKILFPIGAMHKSEVRELAEKYDLPNKQRKDSQGICFLGKIKFREFVKCNLGEKPGDIINFDTKEKLGIHKGYWYYTIGQRQGLGLSGGPWYVVGKDIEKNSVYISKQQKEDHAKDEFEVSDFNWINDKPKKRHFKVKIRHGKQLYNCFFEYTEKNRGRVKLDKKDRGIAPGQFTIFYDGDTCLGCATIQ